MDNELDRNVDIEENSPFQEGIISEIYERLDMSYVQEPQKVKDLIDTNKLVQKFLLKQMDIDKILDIIKRKVLKGTHLPLTIKEIQAGYLSRQDHCIIPHKSICRSSGFSEKISHDEG